MPYVTGTLESKAFQEAKDGKEFAVIEVLPEGKQYALKIRDFDGHVRATPGLTKGSVVIVEFDEKPGTYQGKAITYRNLTSITKGAVPAPTDADVEAFRDSFNADTQSQRPTASRTPTDPIPGANPWAKPAAGYVDPTRASIEAQVALKEAGEFVRDAINQGRVSGDDAAAVRKMLAEYTMLCLSVLHEAQQGGK